ncbi:MAEA-like protein [Mya arenaria]|uniref:MAEA-like protein n=1 Tax=Mya arenaria TaxID=6604 RepID=A0ABY7FNF5_MYAAR|nr:MAEA-like protein [Mya arenaria]
MADIKALEHPTLKVPYELLNKKFRCAQKSIDREVSKVQVVGSELQTCLQKPDITIGEVTLALDSMVEKLKMLKRKADESISEELETARMIKRRVDHLKEAEHLHENTRPLWQKKRLDRMLDLTNIDLFMNSKAVEESLINHETAPCLAWCYENKSKLRKLKSSLEFKLRQQEFIEMIRSNCRLDAVRHARKYFSSQLDEQQLAETQIVMGLLAFSPDTNIPSYKDLLNPERWHNLVRQFRFENFKLHQLNNASVFTALEEMAALNEGQVTCPRSKETHHIEKCEKVYVM